MPSLSSYDRGKKSFEGRSYKADIRAHLDFQDRLWSPLKRRKKRLPERIYCIGNHEHRITRAVELQRELEGTIGLDDLELDYFYDTVVPYEGSSPGSIEVDGVTYAHYFLSGVMGRPIGGEHPASSLLAKQHVSCTAGHLHLGDYSVRTSANGRKIMGCLVGVYQDYDSSYAGKANDLWWRGVVIKRNVHQGQYDVEFISLDTIKKLYR